MSPAIVVGYDGSPDADQALRWALDEAGRTGAEVELVYAWVWPNYLPAASMVPGTSVWPDTEHEAFVERMIAETMSEAQDRHPNLKITYAISHGPAALVLHECSEHAQLLVVGGRSHRPLGGLLLGSVSAAVAAHAACPVVVVRNEYRPGDRRPIVVGLDDSGHADAAARFAFEQAAARGVPLKAVRAWIPPSDPWIGTGFDRDEIDTAERHTLQKLLIGWQEKYPTVPVTAHLIVGHPYHVLIEVARTGQLIVVSARGRGGFPALRLGSVTRHLLHHSPSTIAVVRERAGIP